MSQALQTDQFQPLTQDQHTRFRRLRFLKIKIKTLARESADIRKEMGKTKSTRTKDELREHLICAVRPETRHSLLAYGFLRGRKRSEIEPHLRTFRPKGHPYDIPLNSPTKERVWKLAARFSECQDWNTRTHVGLRDEFAIWWKA